MELTNNEKRLIERLRQLKGLGFTGNSNYEYLLNKFIFLSQRFIEDTLIEKSRGGEIIQIEEVYNQKS